MWFGSPARTASRHKSSPKRIAVASAAIVAALIATAPAAPAYAAGPDAAADADWDPVNRVLEIPQACTKDGVVISCDEGEWNTGQLPDQSAGRPDDADTQTASAGGSQAAGDDGVADTTAELGSVDDYENQEIEEMPVFAGMPMGGYALRPPPYATPNPGPSFPTLAPAWTRPPFGSGPWMIPPSAMMRPAAPMTLVRPPFPLH
jgi:hypothetical protein